MAGSRLLGTRSPADGPLDASSPICPLPGTAAKEAGRFSPARLSKSCGSVFGLVSSIAVAATATATASRRAALAIAVTTVHRSVRLGLKRKLVNRRSAVGALQIQVPYVDHPTLSKTHSISFCGLDPSNTDCRRQRSHSPRYRNWHQKERPLTIDDWIRPAAMSAPMARSDDPRSA
jgi:hypothetical protein